MSSTCCSGESSAPIAAARPPWAQKLELSLSGFRDDHRDARAPVSGGEGRVEAGGSTADDHDVESVVRRHRAANRTRARIQGLYLRHPSSFRHDTGGHPENARRLTAIEEAMAERDWLGLELVEAPAATREQLQRVHGAAHVDTIEAFSAKGGGMIDIDTVTSEGSWEAALHAAGGAVHAAERLLDGGRLRVLRPAAAGPSRRA